MLNIYIILRHKNHSSCKKTLHTMHKTRNIAQLLFCKFRWNCSTIPSSYLLNMGVESHWHVQQDFSLLHTPDKVLDPVLQLMGGLIDLLRVTLACLGQLLRSFKQLISICVCILIKRRHTWSMTMMIGTQYFNSSATKTSHDHIKSNKIIYIRLQITCGLDY